MPKYLLLFPLFVCLASCQKTQTVNTAFSFLNGSTVVSGNNYKATYQVNQSTGVHNFTGFFYGSNSSTYLQFNFTSVNFIVPGTYQLGDTYPNNTSGSLNLYVGSVQYEDVAGNFQIAQIDTVNHLVSGNFQFSGVNAKDMYQTINVSNGSFTNINFTIQ